MQILSGLTTNTYFTPRNSKASLNNTPSINSKAIASQIEQKTYSQKTFPDDIALSKDANQFSNKMMRGYLNNGEFLLYPSKNYPNFVDIRV